MSNDTLFYFISISYRLDDLNCFSRVIRSGFYSYKQAIEYKTFLNIIFLLGTTGLKIDFPIEKLLNFFDVFAEVKTRKYYNDFNP